MENATATKAEESQFIKKWVRCDFYSFCLNLAIRENWTNWSCEQCKHFGESLQKDIVEFRVSDSNDQNYCKRCNVKIAVSNSTFCSKCRKEMRWEKHQSIYFGSMK